MLRLPNKRLALGVAAASTMFAVRQAAAEEPAKVIDRSGKPQVGVASFYGSREAGKITASGDRMEPKKLTAASRTLPLGTQAEVTNKQNGRAVTVTINDRGPYTQGRVVDVTPRAADALGMTSQGVASVEVKPITEPSHKR